MMRVCPAFGLLAFLARRSSETRICLARALPAASITSFGRFAGRLRGRAVGNLPYSVDSLMI